MIGSLRAVETLAPDRRDAVLERLGFATPVTPDRAGLDALYLAWCRTVPFDNLVKRIDVVAGTAPFRNDRPDAFFDLWLAHGTGGTCWPSSRALGALLRTLGFDVRLGSAAMADDVAGPVHSHGTILARVDGELLWVDSSMLTDRPVPLVPGTATRLDHPVRPVRVEPVDDRWRVFWSSGSGTGEMGCLLLDPDVDGEHYSARYEWSRDWSPFNTAVFATRNRPGDVVTFWAGRRDVMAATGHHPGTPLAADERRSVLVDELGYSEAIVDALPADDPPPGAG
jgi:N-hydroxyarylamine O-acetyltransferase